MKVCIDFGHGGNDPGAISDGLSEKNVTLTIGTKLGSLLECSSIQPVFTRTWDETLPLGERVGRANATGADYFVSIHTNADPDPDEPGMPEATGAEIWINPGSVRGRRLAMSIADGIHAEFPDEPWRGIKERGLYVLRNTVMPAALVEVAFIDASESRRRLAQTKVLHQIAFALMRGILNLKGVV